MKQDAFRAWMMGRYSEPSQRTRFHYAKKVEEHYGDLDRHVNDGTINQLLADLGYSLGDGKVGRANPTRIPISGNPYNVLNNCKTGVKTYREFRELDGENEVANEVAIEIASDALKDRREGRQFEVERHLQDSLRREIDQLEPGLTVIDGGAERAVDSGFIDILASDAAGALVVVELKAGEAKREAFGQILGYMGDLQAEEPAAKVRGILVAASFDKSCRAATSVVPSVQLREYRFAFSFVAPE